MRFHDRKSRLKVHALLVRVYCTAKKKKRTVLSQRIPPYYRVIDRQNSRLILTIGRLTSKVIRSDINGAAQRSLQFDMAFVGKCSNIRLNSIASNFTFTRHVCYRARYRSSIRTEGLNRQSQSKRNVRIALRIVRENQARGCSVFIHATYSTDIPGASKRRRANRTISSNDHASRISLARQLPSEI